MKSSKAQLFAGLLALMFAFGLFGGAANASAPGQGAPDTATQPDQRVHFMGVVGAVTERGVVITSRRGEVLVRVDDQTRLMVEREGACVQGALRGLRVGGPASVAGLTTDQRGVILGRLIQQCRPQDVDNPNAKAGEVSSDTSTAPDQRVRFRGRVDSVAEQGILMTTRRGEVRVRVNDNTRIMVEQNGACVEGGLSDLQVGEPAMVMGVTANQRGVVLARGIAQCRADAKK